MNYYSKEQLIELETNLIKTGYQARELKLTYGSLPYDNKQATEFAFQGFLRRVGNLEHSLSRVFAILPPSQEETPEETTLKDAEAHIQAFTINLFGAFDNLAWVWVKQTGLKRPNGAPLPKSEVGLTKKIVRASFSNSFREILEKYDDWFSHLEDFRHSLAHRVPLYIPPFCIDPTNIEKYEVLERREEAAMLQKNAAELESIRLQIKKVQHYKPLMRHSYLDGGPNVSFHAQLISNFSTMHDIAMKMVDELSNGNMNSC